VNEAQAAQSRKDFVHKLKLAAKELNEAAGMIATDASESPTLKKNQQLLLEIAEEIAKIIGKSVATARKNG
jgi:four helix bundle protein